MSDHCERCGENPAEFRVIGERSEVCEHCVEQGDRVHVVIGDCYAVAEVKANQEARP